MEPDDARILREEFDRIGVFLIDSPADDAALEFAIHLAGVAGSSRLYCVHVRGGGEEPVGQDPQQAAFQQHIHERLPAELAGRTTIEVHAASGIPEILHTATAHDLDLVVLGRRLPADQMRAAAPLARLVRRCPCNLLLVTALVRPHLDRLLVPVDCSAQSRRALEVALALARAGPHPSPQVVVQTIFGVGYGYRYSGLGFHEAGRRLETVTRRKVQQFLESIDARGVDLQTICTCSENVADAVHDVAAACKMDMIVIGSRRVRSPAVAGMGSTSEQVALRSAIPVLVIRPKGPPPGLLGRLREALLGPRPE